MPRLSDSMEEGTILNWLVSEGDEVKRGQEIVEIETDKANMTYEADTDGVLVEIVAEEGQTLPLGEVICRIGEPGESPKSSGSSSQDEEEEEGTGAEEEREERRPETATKEREPEPAPGGNGDGRVKASPVARRMARDLGVELAQLEGSGPGGRIVKADVEAAAKSDGAPATEAEPEAAPAAPRAAARALVEKVRQRKITPPEMGGGTFTVSNLGMYGIDRFTAIINPPQAGLLTVGALKKRPTVDERGRVVARDQMTLTLVCDHRILYGADGDEFLARVGELLDQPRSLA